MLQCRHSPQLVQPGIPVALAPRVALTTVVARVQMRTLLQCLHETRDGSSRHLGIPIRLTPRISRATVNARVPSRTLLKFRHETRNSGSQDLRIPITLAHRVERATVIACVPRRTSLQCRTKPEMVAHEISGFQSHSHPSLTRYSDRTHPEAYVAIVSSRNPRWRLTTSWDSNHTGTPRRARYSDRTRLEAYVATVSHVTQDGDPANISGFQSHSHPESNVLQ